MSQDTYSDNHTINILNNNTLNLSAHITSVAGAKFEVNSTAGIHLTSATDYTVMESDSTYIRAEDLIKLESNTGMLLQADNYVTINETQVLTLAADNVYTTSDVNITLTAGDNITLTAGDNATLTAGDNITLDAPELLSLTGTNAVSISSDLVSPSNMAIQSYELMLLSKKNLELICNSSDPNVDPEFGNIILSPHSNGAVEVEQGDLEVASGDLKVSPGAVKTNSITGASDGSNIAISSSRSSGHVLSINNTGGSSSNKSGLWIDINDAGTGPANPGQNNHWVSFLWGGTTKGAIQGASGATVPTWGDYPAFVSSEDPQISSFSVGRTGLGNVQFISGAADFGEYFEAGDLSEWNAEDADRSILGVQEGTLVWVVGRKFYKNKKDGLGIPMLVTNRALVVGGGLPTVKGSDQKACGEVLSFCGVLPVIIEGGSSVGDLIFAADTGNHCISVSKDDVTFRQYMDALGTVLESGPEVGVLPDDHPTNPGEETRFHQRFCAIGVK